MFDVLYESCIWHTRVALFDGKGKLLTVHYDDVLRPFLEGTVALGRVRKVANGLNAAFIDIGDTLDGFLPLNTLPRDIGKISEGQEIMVRVVRAPVDGKGAKLDGRVLTRRPDGQVKVPSIITPHPTALSRTLMDAGDRPVRVWVADERFRNEVIQFVPEDRLFYLSKNPDEMLLEMLDEQIENAAGPVYHIPGGGTLTIEVTRALTAIDVDAGSSADKNTTPLEINKRAADEVFRLCRLLELGGSIVIDFITLRKKEQRNELMQHLKEVFGMDMIDVEIMPMSRSGLVEITRKRTGENLMVRLKWPMYVAGEILLQLWRNRTQRGPVTIEACPDVAVILKSRLGRDEALAYLGVPVTIREDIGLRVDRYRILAAA